jgi:hypothetical protein
MTNVLVQVRFTVDVQEERIASLVGRPDDDSDAYYEQACAKASEWVAENLPVALDMVRDEPDVEAE